MDISVVIPVYGCRDALPELHERLRGTLNSLGVEYEIILVDDCCPQNSWELIKEICAENGNVIGIRLTRNYGQHNAIRAGIDKACGEWTVIMDCDLQDRPENIKELYYKALEGYDVVIKKRRTRREGKVALFFSRLFYRFYNYFTEGTFDSELSNFSIINRKTVEELKKFREQKCDYIILAKWIGGRIAVIEIDDAPRYAGTSSYSFVKKSKMAFDLITQNSDRPLLFSINVGFAISVTAFIFIVYLIIRKMVVNDYDVGWASLIASIYLMGGLILGSVGIVGIYIGKIFDEAKGRPQYVIQEVVNDKTDETR